MSRCLILLLVLIIGGCALQPAHPPVPELMLLPVADGPDVNRVLKQKVLLQKGRTFSFISVMRLSDTEVRGVVLLPTGQTLFGYRYSDDAGLESLMPVPDALPVTEMLALMQFALWPDRALQAYPRAATGWKLELEPGHRQLLWYDRPVVSLTRDAGKMRIEQHEKRYSLQIEDLEPEGL